MVWFNCFSQLAGAHGLEMGDERIRLVIIGGPEVGKSGIVKRFLFNQYTDRYKPTVEDLYNREFDLGPVTIKVFLYTGWILSGLLLFNKCLGAVFCSTKYLPSPFMKVKITSKFMVYE